MTDLERVRVFLQEFCSDDVMMEAAADEALDMIHAHLKEDAERDKDYLNEIVKLREEMDQWSVDAREVCGHNKELARLREQGGLLTEQVMHMDNELVRLREHLARHHPKEVTDTTQYDLEDVLYEREAEIARLREECSRLDTNLDFGARYTKLLEAVKRRPKGVGADGPWLEWWREISQLIEETE